MGRSHWMSAALLLVAAAALVAGTGGSSEPKERFVSIRETDGPALRCRVLKSWQEADGAKVYQVQSLASGEMLTIVEGGSQSPSADVGTAHAMRIIHWGAANHPPSGTPLAPADATVYQARPMPAPVNAPLLARKIEAPAPVMREPAPVNAPVLARKIEAPAPVMREPVAVAQPTPPVLPPVMLPAPASELAAKEFTPPPPVSVALPLPPAPTPPAMVAKVDPPTPVAAPATTVEHLPTAKHVPEPAFAHDAPKAKPTPVTKKPEVAPLPQPVTPPAPAKVEVVETPARFLSPYAMTSPVKKSSPPTVEKQAASESINTVSNNVPAPALPPAPPTVESGSGNDWRQSWGKVDQPKSAMTQSAVPPPATVTVVERPKVPALAPRKVDPLDDPEKYSKTSAEERMARKSKEKYVKELETPVVESKSTPITIEPKKEVISAAKSETPDAKPTPVLLPIERAVSMVPPVPMPASPPPVPQPVLPVIEPVAPVPAAPVAVPVASAPALPVAEPVAPAPVIISKPVETVATPRPETAVVDREPIVSRPTKPEGSLPTRTALPAMIAAAASADMEGPNAFGPANAKPMPAPMPTMMASVHESPRPAVIATGTAAQPTPHVDAELALVAGNAPVSQLLTTLKDSVYPSQREWAADRLTAPEYRGNVTVVDALVQGARSDAAPMVRVGCLRALVRIKATSDTTLTAIRAIKSDADPRVREEAESAVTQLQAARVVQRAR